MIVCTTPDLSDELKETLAAQTQLRVHQKKIAELGARDKEETEILITYGNFEDAVTVEELEQLPNLKWIHVLSSGTEQLPANYTKEQSILVTSSKGIHAIPISEYVIAALLYFAKRIPDFRRLQERMQWSYSEEMFEIHEKTLAVLGTGYIGSEIAKKAKALGMNVIGVNRSGRDTDGFDRIVKMKRLKEILPDCDYVCSALPSTEETRNLIDHGMIRHMKEEVVFINVGRGDLVVEEDLIQALQSGKIAGAALDVFREEPLENGHPFWRMENVLVTPHASARTSRYMERALSIFLNNFSHFRNGETGNLANKVSF